MRRVALLLMAVLLFTAGCATKRTEIQTPLGKFSVDGYQRAAQYAFARPESGKEVFILYLAGDESVTWDQQGLYRYFCEDKPARIAPEDGTSVSAGGISVETGEKSGKIRCALVFEVPETDKTGKTNWTVYWPNGEELTIKN